MVLRLTRSAPLAALAVIYLTMFLFGFMENIKGVAFPLIKAEFGVAYDKQGGLVSAAWFGYVAFCLAASVFLAKFGVKKSVVTGYALVGAGAVLTLAAPSFFAVTLALMVINAGFGFFEVGTNALATVTFTGKSALLMNLMHFFYGFGAVAGPKAAGVLSGTYGLSWREVYAFGLIPTAVAFALVLGVKKEKPAGDAAERGVMTLWDAVKNPVVITFALMLGFMEVVEFAIPNWGGLYLLDTHNLDPKTVGAAFVSSYYIFFTLSRLVGGFAMERTGYARGLALAAGATAVLMAAGFALGLSGMWALAATGFTIAVMWPTTMAYAMSVFGDQSPVATSAIITLSGAVNGVFQYVIGLTNRYVGEAWGYRSCVIYALAILFLLTRLMKMTKKGGGYGKGNAELP